MKKIFLFAVAIVSIFAVNTYACNRGGYRGGCGISSGGCGISSGGCGISSGGCGISSGGCGISSGGCGISSGGCGGGGCQPQYYTNYQPMYQQCQPMYQPPVQRFRPMNQGGCPDGSCNVRVIQPLPTQPLPTQPVESQKTYKIKQAEMPSIRDFFDE